MTPQPHCDHNEVCAEEDFCKGCGNFDGFYNSCKLSQYKTSIQGKVVWIAPRTNGTRWLLKTVGCASDTRSRPHIPAAPSHLSPDDRGWEQGFQDGQASALVDLNVHAATIRNQTLDALFQKANQRQMDVETEEGTIVEVIEKGEVLAWIDELRSTQSTDSEATDR